MRYIDTNIANVQCIVLQNDLFFHQNLPTKLKFPNQKIDHLLSSNLRRYIVVGTEIEFHIYRENVKISENFTVFTS